MKLAVSIVFCVLAGQVVLAQSNACKAMNNKKIEMDVIGANIANVNTTKTPEGGPYKRKKFVCNEKFCAIVSYKDVVIKHMPGHPDANAQGDVKFPAINLDEEMQSLITARGSYEKASRNCREITQN